MNRVCTTFRVLLLCGLLSSRVYPQAAPPATAPTIPAATTAISVSHLIELRMSPDARVRSAARKIALAETFVRDLRSPDAQVEVTAVEQLKKVAFTSIIDPGGQPLIDNSGWCRRNLEWKDGFFKPLMEKKQYDLLRDLANKAMSEGYDDTDGFDSVLGELVQVDIAAGKYDDALPIAKTYYNFCKLESTAAATDAMLEVLANTLGKTDHRITRRFKEQQTATPSSTTGKNSPDNVLASIKVDVTSYKAAYDALASEPNKVKTLTARGNLLLLMDRAAEAHDAFEMAVDLSTDPKVLSAQVANVARSIRARDGSAASANAYIISLRNGGKP